MTRPPINNRNWRDGSTVWEWNVKQNEWFAYAEQSNRHNQRRPWRNPNPILSVLSGNG